MKNRLTAVIALVLLSGQAVAQTQPSPPAAKPAEPTQAPENQAINPDQRTPPTSAAKPVSQSGAQTPPATDAKAAKSDKPEKWNVNAPPGMATREIRINVDNGTWMNVDVSRDGKLIAFDPLGCDTGETVLVTQGSVAAGYFQGQTVPVDALIIGSIDETK